MPKTVLITGGTGTIGQEITRQLHKKGYEVRYLTTGKTDLSGKVNKFHWNPAKDEIEESSIAGVENIIHLAGANISNRWTTRYKREIFESRTTSLQLLYNTLERHPHSINTLVSASGVSIYPSDFEKNYHETDPPGNDFIANVCRHWEAEASKFSSLNVREVRLRTGFVLSKKGGALEQFVKPVKYYVGAPLGNGKQWIPWIHIEDLAAMYIFAMENQHLRGVYNAVGPKSATNAELTKEIATVLKKPLWLPNIPAFVLKVVLGEMATLALSSTKVSSKKIEDAGYEFKFENLNTALRDLL